MSDEIAKDTSAYSKVLTNKTKAIPKNAVGNNKVNSGNNKKGRTTPPAVPPRRGISIEKNGKKSIGTTNHKDPNCNPNSGQIDDPNSAPVFSPQNVSSSASSLCSTTSASCQDVIEEKIKLSVTFDPNPTFLSKKGNHRHDLLSVLFLVSYHQ